MRRAMEVCLRQLTMEGTNPDRLAVCVGRRLAAPRKSDPVIQPPLFERMKGLDEHL